MSQQKGEAAVARPSSSVVLLSPTNEVLLLHRVQSSTSFASAHVFPGGNLDAFHDGPVPAPDSPARHVDGPAYRMAAVRECFEETGILLAKRHGLLVNLPAEERDAARRRIHANEVAFGDWLASLGAVADTENLVPFTRWITPVGPPKRFTTQMYLYLLPISRADVPSEMLIPTPDNGVEHTAATPVHLLVRKSDGRLVLGLDRPGPELKGTDRGGDWERVALVRFGKDGPRELDVRWRADVLREEKEAVEQDKAKM
ncbi:hypothetical protein HIM_04568 [Hirsutella minnesotensis 3608]|uniref:Nudix hydrolase domain-containing protein n=1 Tax=Hirsutella minnesotensis 3608 TaxID=1043627 RepID=A0A0F8A1C8_9HYPO|nr:hypothetical protein HIM_04568 [Hirsutella minnesotensis 3608]